MNLFFKMKKKLKIVLVSNFAFWLILNIVGGILSIFVYPLIFVLTLFLSVLIFTLVLKIYTPYFNRDRNRVMNVAFSKTSHEDLEFEYYKEEDYEAFDALDIEKLAPLFDISAVISGTYNNTKVESFNAMYTPTGKKRDLINLRVYIFENNKAIDKVVNNHTIKHELFDKATCGKYSACLSNKLYIAYAYENKYLPMSFEPMSHAKYDTFLDRYNKEIDFIDYITKLIK